MRPPEEVKKDNIMNPEIHSIVKTMLGLSKEDAYAESDKHTRQLALMGRLLSLLAKESERQSKKMIRFTKAIVALTCALIFIGIVQIVMMIVNLKCMLFLS